MNKAKKREHAKWKIWMKTQKMDKVFRGKIIFVFVLFLFHSVSNKWKYKNFSYCKWNKMVAVSELTLISAAIYPFFQKV